MKFKEFIKKNVVLVIGVAALLAILCLLLPSGIMKYGSERVRETRVNGFGILFGKNYEGHQMYKASGGAITMFVFFLIFLASAILINVIKINDKVSSLALFISAGSLALASFFYIAIKNYINYYQAAVYGDYFRVLMGIPLGGLILFATSHVVLFIALENSEMFKKA